MVSDDKLKEIIAQVVGEMMKDAPAAAKSPAPACCECKNEGAKNEECCGEVKVNANLTVPGNRQGVAGIVENVSDDDLEDLTTYELNEWYQVPNAKDEAEYRRLKLTTPARLGVWHCGPREMTNTMLRFRADHAAAQDAVFNEFPKEFLEERGILELQSRCDSKDTYLTRPDLGRRLSEESAEKLKNFYKKAPTCVVFAADGLSGTAIEANYDIVIPALMNGLKAHGIDAGEPFFVRYGRVAVQDEVSEITGCDVCVCLIGERPGLATAKSMSAYITYKGTIGMSEARRTVVSNIHNAGTPAAEAGAHIADIVDIMLKEKASGTDLKL